MKNVVIIGAGPAGLSAAYYLAKYADDYKVTILDKNETPGGISRTIRTGSLNYDIGGHRLYTDSNEILELWKNLFKSASKESESLLNISRNTHIFTKKSIISYPINGIRDIFSVIKGGWLFDIIPGVIISEIFPRKEKTLEDYYINRFGKGLYKKFFKDYTYKIMGYDPSEIDKKWGNERVRKVSIISIIQEYIGKCFGKKNVINEKSLTRSFYYPATGIGTLWEKLEYSILNNITAMHNTTVTKIHLDENNKPYAVSFVNNNTGRMEKMECDILISSAPLNDLPKLFDKNIFGECLSNKMVNLPYRDYIILTAVIDKEHFQNGLKKTKFNNIKNDVWIYTESKKMISGRIQFFSNWSDHLINNKNCVLVGLELFVNKNDKIWDADKRRLKLIIYNDLSALKIIQSVDDIKDFYITKQEKAYPVYCGTFNYYKEIIDAVDNIEGFYSIGRNGRHCYDNMDIAMQSGFDAAKKIIETKSK